MAQGIGPAGRLYSEISYNLQFWGHHSTTCTDGDEICRGWVYCRLLHAIFHPLISATRRHCAKKPQNRPLDNLNTSVCAAVILPIIIIS